MNAIQTKKITKSDIKSMKSDENLLINFNCRWEKTSQLLGFIEIPLLELYKTLKETSKKKEFTIFSEWFNILSFHKDEQLFVIGKAKVSLNFKRYIIIQEFLFLD